MPDIPTISVIPLPPRARPTERSFDTDPKRVQAWVGQLPMANLGHAVKAVFHALIEVNRLDIAPGTRLQFMEAVRDPVRSLSEAMERQLVDQTFPLPKREHQIAVLARELQEEMALGYKLVLQGLLGERSGHRRLFRNTQLCVPLHRALRYMGRILLHCYQIYAPYPENTWREIHHLYQLAEDMQCVNRPIVDPHYNLIEKNTTEEAYKQVLLLALASPYRLRPGEAVVVYTALEQLSSHCRLSPIADRSSQPQGLFAVQLDSDQQPNHLQLHSGHNQRMAWVLDTTALGALLRRQLTRLQHSDQQPMKRPVDLPRDMNIALLQRLMQSWGMMAERRFDRFPRDGYAEMVLGLGGAHRALGGPPRADPVLESDEEDQPRPSLEHDVTLDAHLGAVWASTTRVQPDFESYRCRILDASPGGFRLEWHGDNRVKLKIGNLIAVRQTGEQGGAPGWSLGLIRWMRVAAGDAVELGVQSCAGAAEPVLMRVCSAEGRCGDFVEGF